MHYDEKEIENNFKFCEPIYFGKANYQKKKIYENNPLE